MSSVPRTRTGCQSCRVRHLKCDEQRPSCTRCAKSGIECVRGYNIRFRHSLNPSVANLKEFGLGKCEYDFAKNQPWCKTTHNLSYVDETPELRNIYDHDQDSNDNIVVTPPGFRDNVAADLADDFSVSSVPHRSRAVQPSPSSRQSISEAGSSPKRRKLELPHRSDAASQRSPGQESGLLIRSGSQVQLTPPVGTASNPAFPSLEPASSLASDFAADFPSISSTSLALSKIYLETPVWPLEKKEEAALLRYFVDNLAASFDLCDPDRHFQLVVPHRAAVCPPLLNAILAVSARHWSRVGDYDPYVAERYHSECLKHLIPMLDETAALMDENLLAATVILRFLEEIDIPVSGTESQSHLLGTQVFLTAQERSTVYGGLRQAAFWVGLRQEIYMAFVNQRTIIPVLEHCNIDRSFENASDCVWANRIVTHCADVLRYCFGDGEQSLANYNRLLDYCDGWYMFKPPSFSPIYYREPDGQSVVFPEVWLLSDAVTTGLQHYHLAKILLTAHNPKVPRLGPGQKHALTKMDVSMFPSRWHDLSLTFIARSKSKTTCEHFAAWPCPTSVAHRTSCTIHSFPAIRQSPGPKGLTQLLEPHPWPSPSRENDSPIGRNKQPSWKYSRSARMSTHGPRLSRK
ncbi:hypothetical protein MPH_04799 [Macrophomina phaseolina MS6]|uniref:Zn(2)-C6 fungal-type domain-containing protein n=1 Tax=Macrophomina phaseolina (strain MS6) TaxID=1126212 RepID=K2RYZ1_MACPH|nr:hypothetical protein MPH_04799 [Macrophomina phaseolina MS6]